MFNNLKDKTINRCQAYQTSIFCAFSWIQTTSNLGGGAIDSSKVDYENNKKEDIEIMNDDNRIKMKPVCIRRYSPVCIFYKLFDKSFCKLVDKYFCKLFDKYL